jgi:mannose-1-phosphate guanylyltransferase
MVLAAGLGTRLRPLTDELPKPLLPLGDRPVLAHVVERLRAAGIVEGAVNSHHLSHKIKEFTRVSGFFLHVEQEDEIRGTAGGVWGARSKLGDAPVLVSNADLIFDVPAASLIGAVVRSGTMAFAVARRPAGEGAVGLGVNDEIVRLRGERFGNEVGGADYLGVMALGSDALDRLPSKGCLVGDVALPLLRRGRSLSAVAVLSPFWSLGDSIGDYLDANRAWLEAGGGHGSYCGEGAHVAEGVELASSVVGPGASLTGGGLVERSVIWPGARARAPLVDCVVTTGGAVVGRDGSVSRY